MLKNKYIWVICLPILLTALFATLIPFGETIQIINPITIILLILSAVFSFILLVVKVKGILFLKFAFLAIVSWYYLLMIGLANTTNDVDYKLLIALALCFFVVTFTIITLIYEYRNFNQIYKSEEKL